MNSFSLKSVRIEIAPGQGSGPIGLAGTKVIEGLACDVTVQKPGLPEKNSASVKIWGMQYADMAQLTKLSFKPLETQRNVLTVKAGEVSALGVVSSLSTIFQGEITSAWADFNAAPDVCMMFQASSGSFPQLISQPVTTVQGEVPAVQLFAQFAQAAGYAFRDEGVTASVKDAWFPGSPINKMMKLAHDVGCELIIDDGSIIVLPEGQPRLGNAVPLSAQTGLIGYPTFTQDGIACRCLFNPDLKHGGLISVDSIVPRASGMWRISKLTHQVSAYKPGGDNWESQIEAAFTL